MGISSAVTRGRYIIRENGATAFLSGLIAYIKDNIYSHGVYDIYEIRLPLARSPVFDAGDAHLTPIATTAQLQQMIADNYNFAGFSFTDRISGGGVAFCIFAAKKLAHVTWVAFNERVKRDVDPLPFKVNFQEQEVCSGDSFTDPAHRGKGYLKAAYGYLLPYLSDRGIRRVLFSIRKDNVPSQKALVHFHPSPIGEGHYSKILCWQRWE